ncbi:unnamed protein product [Cuscuta campestris]|uniref:Uncharacterized protein n=1 Tax=Cuscuta campestris TaxID=132261 RepID=A0A484K8S4_9ASTE|nr:unnamed protein product [Cuscuta campestris]
MPETRCRFAVNLTTFTLPLVLDFILICIYYWAYNSCVKIKDVQVPLQIGGFLLSVMGGFSLLTFCKRKSIECGACSFCSYIVFAVIFFVVVFFSLNYGFNTGLSGSSFDRAEPYGSHPRLDHFPQAFRDKVSGAEEWDHIIACLAPSIGCDRLNRTYTSPQQLSSAHLNPLQSQCCMPPSQCGLSFEVKCTLARMMESNEKWKGRVSARLQKATADHIWPLFLDFFSLNKWFPGLAVCHGVHGTNGEPGCVRYCAGFSLPSESG